MFAHAHVKGMAARWRSAARPLLRISRSGARTDDRERAVPCWARCPSMVG